LFRAVQNRSSASAGVAVIVAVILSRPNWLSFATTSIQFTADRSTNVGSFAGVWGCPIRRSIWARMTRALSLEATIVEWGRGAMPPFRSRWLRSRVPRSGAGAASPQCRDRDGARRTGQRGLHSPSRPVFHGQLGHPPAFESGSP